MARELDLKDTESLLTASRGEEQRMAGWIDRRIEKVTADYLERIDEIKHTATVSG
jgi:hypothetical protein